MALFCGHFRPHPISAYSKFRSRDDRNGQRGKALDLSSQQRRESQVWDPSCQGKWDGPPDGVLYRTSLTTTQIPFLRPSPARLQPLNLGVLGSHLKIPEQSSTQSVHDVEPAPAAAPSPYTCYCANFSEDLGPPVTDWAKATRQHQELGQNLQLLFRTWEMQVAQEESCLAVEAWEEEGRGFSRGDRVHGHALVVVMTLREIASSTGPLPHDPSPVSPSSPQDHCPHPPLCAT